MSLLHLTIVMVSVASSLGNRRTLPVQNGSTEQVYARLLRRHNRHSRLCNFYCILFNLPGAQDSPIEFEQFPLSTRRLEG